MKMLFIGEINPDLILQGYESFPALGREVLVQDSSLVLGSASAICASAAATLGNQVAFFGKVGCDVWGDFSLQRMQSVGVDTSPVIRDPTLKTGITVSISGARDRALVTHLGAIAALTEADVQDDLFHGFAHLHLSTYFMQQGLRPGVALLLNRATRAGLTCSLDPGCDPAGKWDDGIREAIRNTDVFFPNEVELAGITGIPDPEEALRSLANSRTLIVAKLGAAGCMTIMGGRVIEVPPMPVEPIDTTGAGDSFDAAFLHFWLRRRPLEEALQFGAVYGALSTLGLGGTGHHVPYEQAEAAWLRHFRKVN
jgi:sugar/nucleoside kinase (ribokinase family)